MTPSTTSAEDALPRTILPRRGLSTAIHHWSMTNTLRTSVALLCAVVLAGCSATVQGHALRPGPSSAEQALPSPAALGRVLNFPMQIDSPPQVGGTEVLRDDRRSTDPAECTAVTHAGDRQTYSDAPVRLVARGSWKTPQSSDDQVSVGITILELDSSANAQSWYEEVAGRWRHCQDTTVTQRVETMSFIQDVGHVSDSDGMLTVDMHVSSTDGIMSPSTNRRALTSSARFLIDVELLESAGSTDDPNPGGGATAVAGLVKQLLDAD
jgi:PknH-like protein